MFVRFVCVALLIVCFGCSGEQQASIPVVPEQDAAFDASATAQQLATQTLPQAEYDKLLLLSEEERTQLRNELVPLVGETGIDVRPDLYAVVGPAEGEVYRADDVNAAVPFLERSGVGQGTDTSWVLYINVPFYSQRDPSWQGVPLGFGRGSTTNTIGNYGCHLCCISMLYAKWGYPAMNPPGLNAWAFGGRLHYAFVDAGWGNEIRREEALQYPGICRPWSYVPISQLWGTIASGKPIVVKYPNHFVVMFGYGDGRYWVKDPWQDGAHQDQPLGDAVQFRLYGYL